MKHAIFILSLILLSGCVQSSAEIPFREDLIPENAIKMTPLNDIIPPLLLSEEFEEPVPLPYPANTKGLEDSSFVMPDGKTIYIWFTPNNKMDVLEQSQDLVTGIYKFTKTLNGWSSPERIWLATPEEPHLDGCGFFKENQVWICGARKGYIGLNWFTSVFENNTWSIAEIADFTSSYEIGELHISKDGDELYFHSARNGTKGGLDLWLSEKINDTWQEPVNLENLNTEFDEGWPALNPQEDELWITRNYGIWRSKRANGIWQTPEQIVSNLAGEATIDNEGNVYFTHHYFENNTMIEADIYVIYKR